MNIESMRHAEVVAFIKNGGNETRLLVVDPDTDEHFKKIGITPTSIHVKGRVKDFAEITVHELHLKEKNISHVTFICTALLTVHIVSEQLYRNE